MTLLTYFSIVSCHNELKRFNLIQKLSLSIIKTLFKKNIFFTLHMEGIILCTWVCGPIYGWIYNQLQPYPHLSSTFTKKSLPNNQYVIF